MVAHLGCSGWIVESFRLQSRFNHCVALRMLSWIHSQHSLKPGEAVERPLGGVESHRDFWRQLTRKG